MNTSQQESGTSSAETTTSEVPKRMARRHDLDSLRAVAMLLGIVLHGSLAYFIMPFWPVQDVNQHDGIGGMFLMLHGFRMPLFFLISGFFTAMLWRYRGLESLVQHRFKRIFLPLVIGLLTIIPLMNFVTDFVTENAMPTFGINAPNMQGVEPESPITVKPVSLTDSYPQQDIFDAAFSGDLDAVIANLQAGVDVNAKEPGKRSTPLQIAAFAKHKHIVEFLIKKKADLFYRNLDGATALEIAYFVGAEDIAAVLQGAMEDSPTPELSETEPFEFDDFLQVDDQLVAPDSLAASYHAWLNGPTWNTSNDPFAFNFMHTPVFHHLWFLWFLCWLVVGFIFYSKAVEALNLKQLPNWLIVSPLRYLWLIPVTMFAQQFMLMPVFGPDTSAGLLPYPHMLLYYGIFFFFGALYFDVNDESGIISKFWQMELGIGVCLFFFGVEAAVGDVSNFESIIAPEYYGLLSNLIQVTYAWTMTFAFMGLFRALFYSENKKMRYMSDSSYWLYLMHLPLIILFQYMLRDEGMPAVLKLVLICVVSSGILLLTYEFCVRYTPIGTLLNGKKTRSTENTE